jgi:GTP cyclohydrolase I
MTGRGVRTHGVTMTTSKMLGCFRDAPTSRREIMTLMQSQ